VTEWIGGWTAENPPDVQYGYVGPDDGDWTATSVDGLEQRDLGGATGTQGAMDAYEVRAAGGAVEVDWHAYDADFQLFCPREGTMHVETEAGDSFDLGPGDILCLPAITRYRAELSEDVLLINVRAPAGATEIKGRDAALPERAASLDPDRKPILSPDVPELFSVGTGQAARTFFTYRDPGAEAPTEGRVRIEVLRTVEPGVSAGWHYHTMGQIAIILKGRALIEVDANGPVELVPGSACTIGNNPHYLGELTSDYELLEVFMPANYDTIPCKAPDGAAYANA
jgi:quercetin dioxygenase-like cupin family protein